jgi:predicted MFS family arabinose efflux permease
MNAKDAGVLGSDFLRLWGAQAVSSLGARISREGLPLTAVLVLGASPAQIGVLAAAVGAPAVLVGLAGGAVIDRAPGRRLLITADLARAGVLLAVPAAALAHRLTLVGLFVAAATIGALSDLFDIADHAFLPSLVGRAQLVRANARLAATEAAGEIGGPALAGALVSLLTAPVALAVNAAAYLASVAVLATIRHRETPPVAAAPWRSELTVGLRFAWRGREVRALLLMGVTTGLFGGFFAALYIVWALRSLGLTAVLLGATIAVGGVGALAGAALAGPLAARLGVGRALIASALLTAAFAALIPLAHGPRALAMIMLMAAQLFGDAFGAASLVYAVSLRQGLVPQDQLGRVGGAFIAAQGLAAVAGALAGGLLGERLGMRPTLALACVGLALAPLWLVASPVRGIHTLPPAIETEADGQD